MFEKKTPSNSTVLFLFKIHSGFKIFSIPSYTLWSVWYETLIISKDVLANAHIAKNSESFLMENFHLFFY